MYFSYILFHADSPHANSGFITIQLLSTLLTNAHTHAHKMSIGSFPNFVLMDPITDSMNNQWPLVCNCSAKTLSETEFS